MSKQANSSLHAPDRRPAVTWCRKQLASCGDAAAAALDDIAAVQAWYRREFECVTKKQAAGRDLVLGMIRSQCRRALIEAGMDTGPAHLAASEIMHIDPAENFTARKTWTA